MTASTKSNVISSYIMTTWRHWAFSLGLVCVMVMLSTFVSRHFFPYIAFAFAALLAVMIYNRRNRHNQGLAIPYIVTVSLLIEGFLLTGFNLTVKITDIYELAGTPVNDELPFIVQLSMSPVIALVSGVFMLRRLGRGRFFRTRAGRSDVSLVQRMVWQETRYQTRLLFLISIGMSVAEWIYTFFVFTSVSINKPDMFFFVWLPVIVYALSLVYLGFRCVSLWAFYSQNDTVKMLNPNRSSVVRFLIVSDDSLYLSRHKLDVKHGMESYFDTPVRLSMPYTDKYSGTDALSLFKKYTGIDAGIEVVKFLFDGFGHGLDNSFFHYLCVLSSPADVKGTRIEGGQWLSLDEIRRLDYNHRLSAELSAELVHIYTVAMAWKSYDIDGNRRYSIKNYRPTYRLCDIKKWDVDYTDSRWLKVARLNADKPLFRIRRFLSRLTSPSLQ